MKARNKAKRSKTPAQVFKPKAPASGVQVDRSAREERRAVQHLRAILNGG